MKKSKVFLSILLFFGLLNLSDNLSASQRKPKRKFDEEIEGLGKKRKSSENKKVKALKPKIKVKKRAKKAYVSPCHICHTTIDKGALISKLNKRTIHAACLKNHDFKCHMCDLPSILDSDSEDARNKENSEDDIASVASTIAYGPEDDIASVASTIAYGPKDDISTIAYGPEDEKTVTYPVEVAHPVEDIEQAIINRFVKNIWLLSPTSAQQASFLKALSKKGSDFQLMCYKNSIPGSIGHTIIESLLSKHRTAKKSALPAIEIPDDGDDFDRLLRDDHKQEQKAEVKALIPGGHEQALVIHQAFEVKDEQEEKIVHNALIAIQAIDAKILEENYKELEEWTNFQDYLKKKSGEALLNSIALFFDAFVDQWLSLEKLRTIAVQIKKNYAENFPDIKIKLESVYLSALEQIGMMTARITSYTLKTYFKSNVHAYEQACAHAALGLAHKRLIDRSDALKKAVADILKKEQDLSKENEDLQERINELHEQEVQHYKHQAEKAKKDLLISEQQREIENLRRAAAQQRQKKWTDYCVIL